MDCGYNFGSESSILGNGKIFLVIIAIVVVLGLAVIAMTGSGNNNVEVNQTVENSDNPIDLTIDTVGGWDSTEGKKSYTLYTTAYFNKVPDDLKGYIIKTTYYDKKDNPIGQEKDNLKDIYYDSDYDLTFGVYTTYKLPDPDHVTVEVIKDGKVIGDYTEKIDTNKIGYLN